MKFTVEQIKELKLENCICDENGEVLYDIVDEIWESFDQEKNSTTFQVIIRDIKARQYYRTYWSQSDWYLQDQHNAEQPLKRVYRKKETTYYYTEYK